MIKTRRKPYIFIIRDENYLTDTRISSTYSFRLTTLRCTDRKHFLLAWNLLKGSLITLEKQQFVVVESFSWLDLVQMEMPNHENFGFDSKFCLSKYQNLPSQYNLRGRVKVIIAFVFKRPSFSCKYP